MKPTSKQASQQRAGVAGPVSGAPAPIPRTIHQPKERGAAMKYSKPEVVALVDAVNAIQGSAMGKEFPTQVEQHTHGTPAAYEADE
jgi:hypothetical protein